MADEEHVALLKLGVDAWNAWRQGNPDIRPDLWGTDLRGADLRGADLREANLFRADLGDAILNRADFTGADLTECRIHGVSAWALKLNEETKQENLIINDYDEPEITVDNIEVAQFIYLLL